MSDARVIVNQYRQTAEIHFMAVCLDGGCIYSLESIAIMMRLVISSG